MKEMLNWGYLKSIKEPYLILKTLFLRRDKSLKKTNRVLIVNAALVGDFMTSLPALATFIKNNKNVKIDLMVSPPIKELAEKIKGINKVFVAKSYALREIENVKIPKQDFGVYDKIIVMMISTHSFSLLKKIKSKKIQSSPGKFLRYAFYLVRDGILGKKPIQKKFIYFDLLGEKETDVKFEEIFNFTKKDYERIKKFDVLNTKHKIVIIHTGPVWIMRAWENNKWAELIKKMNSSGNFRFVFVGTGEAQKDFKEISEKLDFKVYSLIDKVNLLDLLLILRKSNYLIGVDSGPRNMAHTADLRSISLFGPGAGGAIHMPFDKKDIIIDPSNGGAGYQNLIYTKKGYISKITSEEVFEAFKKLSNSV